MLGNPKYDKGYNLGYRFALEGNLDICQTNEGRTALTCDCAGCTGFQAGWVRGIHHAVERFCNEQAHDFRKLYGTDPTDFDKGEPNDPNPPA